MHHILWVLQFTLGQSVIDLLFAPSSHLNLTSNCVPWSLTETQRRPIDLSKATCLSVIFSHSCPKIQQWQLFETVLGEGRVMLHTLVHPFEIQSSFPK